ncbi:MAG: DUF362 domain-containing protein [Armatimonadota bacterium]|nr:MAG: DUF362 domain-containing protein [Armatimonadota bacterium]
MGIPRLAEIEQRLYSRRVRSIPGAVLRAWETVGMGRSIRRRDRVGITVGSRGIENIAAVTRSVADLVKQAGGKPFIIPAMGSHGGATAAGQTALLKSLGVTPASVGAPIRASMAAVKVGETSHGAAVYASQEALKADGLIVMNRIKQHTDFVGEYESGLVKMLAVGLGKRRGAMVMHSRSCVSLREDIPEAARILLKRLRVVGGLAIFENGRHQTADIVGLRQEEILPRERALLRRARRTAARIPFREVDLLIVDWIGKDISGVGFDTHVIARRMIWGEQEFRGPRIGVVAALDVTPGSRGNALGVGLADLVTERLVRKIDWSAVKTNVLHTGFLNRAKVPIALRNDRELVRAAMTALGDPDRRRVRVVRITDTLSLGRMWVSEGLLPEARRHPRVRAVGRPTEMKFDRSGNLK